jgi:hypothetical protein
MAVKKPTVMKNSSFAILRPQTPQRIIVLYTVPGTVGRYPKGVLDSLLPAPSLERYDHMVVSLNGAAARPLCASTCLENRWN